MKRSVFLTIVLGLLLSFGITGCRTGPHKGVTVIPGRQTPVPDSVRNPGPLDTERPGPIIDTTGTRSQDIPLIEREGNLDDRPKDYDIFADYTVYFDFDRATVKPSETPKLEQVASYLQTNPGGDLLIEGHCDERGTDGYNEALGERRAISIKDYLTNLGVNPSRLHTVTYGASRPAVNERSESAYAKNRRGQLVLLLPAR